MFPETISACHNRGRLGILENDIVEKYYEGKRRREIGSVAGSNKAEQKSEEGSKNKGLEPGITGTRN